jgi:hypothetical protein
MVTTLLKYLKLTAAISVSLAATYCNSGRVAEEASIKARTPVTIVSPAFKSLSQTVEFPAVSTFLVKNTVRSGTSGIVETVNITPGENIKAGFLLFTLKTREAAALQNAASNDTTLNFRGMIRINSPKDGVISSVIHQAGDFVQEGDELAVISDSRSLVFIMEVPFEMKEIADKNKECVLNLQDSSVIKGTIVRRLPEMNLQDQTVSYLIRPVTSRYLPQNLLASAILSKSLPRKALVLPRQSILGNETQSEFWIMKVINDTTAVRINIVKGIENRDETEITSPVLTPDDRILMTGNYGLPDTAAIEIVQ